MHLPLQPTATVCCGHCSPVPVCSPAPGTAESGFQNSCTSLELYTGPPSQDTGVTGEPARCVFCIVQSTPKTPLTVPPICCYLTDLSRDHFLWGEKRHIYISGKMDPCTLPVRSQNQQKAGRNQDRNHHLHLSGATTVSVETGVCGFRKVNWKPSESMRG